MKLEIQQSLDIIHIEEIERNLYWESESIRPVGKKTLEY